jgi:hypothetical protein
MELSEDLLDSKAAMTSFTMASSLYFTKHPIHNPGIRRHRGRQQPIPLLPIALSPHIPHDLEQDLGIKHDPSPLNHYRRKEFRQGFPHLWYSRIQSQNILVVVVGEFEPDWLEVEFSDVEAYDLEGFGEDVEVTQELVVV